jgi:hypothetical protein
MPDTISVYPEINNEDGGGLVPCLMLECQLCKRRENLKSGGGSIGVEMEIASFRKIHQRCIERRQKKTKVYS